MTLKQAPIALPKAKAGHESPKSKSSPSMPSESSDSSTKTSLNLPALPTTPTPSNDLTTARELGYEAVDLPTPTMDVHSFKGLHRDQVSPWRQAADLTTDYEDIDLLTLDGQTVEPRPQTPPRILRIRPPPTEGELFSINRSFMIAVAKKADWWAKGPRYMLPIKFNILVETPDFRDQTMKAKDDVRYIIEHVGRDENGEVDMVKAADFFKRVVAFLQRIAEGSEGGIVDSYNYQSAIAEGLYRAGLSLNMEALVVLDKVGAMWLRQSVPTKIRAPTGNKD